MQCSTVKKQTYTGKKTLNLPHYEKFVSKCRIHEPLHFEPLHFLQHDSVKTKWFRSLTGLPVPILTFPTEAHSPFAYSSLSVMASQALNTLTC